MRKLHKHSVLKFSALLLSLLPALCLSNDLIFEKNVTQIHEAMQEGKLSAHELVDYYLKRIKVYDGALNSIITINPNALTEADKIDAKIASGEPLGPLYGIPILLKDNYDTADMKTTSGALAFKDLQPVKDAFTVAKLRQAGAIILAKTNLTELARHGMTVSSMGGQTLNPYDLTRTPGGSSGGTGAAVAANFAVMGTGSDTVNSIRSPSSANSLVGIRPTKGLVSRTGISPCSDWQDMGGPIARNVADAALMLSVMAGYDPQDQSTNVIKNKKIENYTDALDTDGLKGKKLALLTTNLGEDPEVLRIVNSAIDDLTALGAEVIKVDLPQLKLADLLKNNDVQEWEQAPYLDKYLASIGSGSSIKTAAEYVKSGLLTPSIVNEMTRMVNEKDPLNNPKYLARIKKNKELAANITEFMHKNKIDAFVYPLQSVLVVKTTESKGQYARNGLMASVMGFPAITLPGGFSSSHDTAPIGVPVGIELMGEPFSESKLISMGYAYEQGTHNRKPPVAFPDLDFSSIK